MEILRTCLPVRWSEVATISGLKNLREIDIGLRSRIHGLNEKLSKDDWAKTLDEMPGLICPTEGCFSPFIENKFLTSLKNHGYSKVIVRDEHLSKISTREISELTNVEEIPYAGSILTEDEGIYATTHWDSHFSFFCFKSKDLLNEIIARDGYEGFFCDQETEVYWSVRNLTSTST